MSEARKNVGTGFFSCEKMNFKRSNLKTNQDKEPSGRRFYCWVSGPLDSWLSSQTKHRRLFVQWCARKCDTHQSVAMWHGYTQAIAPTGRRRRFCKLD